MQNDRANTVRPYRVDASGGIPKNQSIPSISVADSSPFQREPKNPQTTKITLNKIQSDFIHIINLLAFWCVENFQHLFIEGFLIKVKLIEFLTHSVFPCRCDDFFKFIILKTFKH